MSGARFSNVRLIFEEVGRGDTVLAVCASFPHYLFPLPVQLAQQMQAVQTADSILNHMLKNATGVARVLPQQNLFPAKGSSPLVSSLGAFLIPQEETTKRNVCKSPEYTKCLHVAIFFVNNYVSTRISPISVFFCSAILSLLLLWFDFIQTCPLFR